VWSWVEASGFVFGTTAFASTAAPVGGVVVVAVV